MVRETHSKKNQNFGPLYLLKWSSSVDLTLCGQVDKREIDIQQRNEHMKLNL